MHNSWKHLTIKNQEELRDPSRLKKLMRARRMGLIPILGFGAFGLISFGFGGFLVQLAIEIPEERLMFSICALLMIPLGIGFFIGSYFFKKERDLDIIYHYLKDPAPFEFIEGKLNSGSYRSSENKSGRAYIALASGKAPNGTKVEASETFSVRAWPFTTKEEDDQIQEGDDWYDMKGKRKYLPVPVYLLYHKHNLFLAAIVGIDAEKV